MSIAGRLLLLLWSSGLILGTVAMETPSYSFSISQRALQTVQGDSLRISVFSSIVGAKIQWYTRTFVESKRGPQWSGPSGQITTDGTRSAQTGTIPLSTGVLLDMVVEVASGTVKRGQVFVRVEMIPATGQTNLQSLIVSNYVTSGLPVSMLQTPVQSSLEGSGYLTFDSTLVGPSLTMTVPSNAQRKVYSVWFAPVLSAVVADRYLIVTAQNTLIIYQVALRTALTANFVGIITFGDVQDYAAPMATLNLGTVQIPAAMLSAGGQILAQLNNNQAGDVDPIAIYYEEWLDV